MNDETKHVIDAVEIASLSSRQYIEDAYTGEMTLDPVYGHRHSVELMLPEGGSVAGMRFGGKWRMTLELMTEETT